jgi:hypothetical protein
MPEKLPNKSTCTTDCRKWQRNEMKSIETGMSRITKASYVGDATKSITGKNSLHGKKP